MYEILNFVYGATPTSEEQYKSIIEHYGKWPEHLGYASFPAVDDSFDVGGSGYIGVKIEDDTFNGIWEVHGKKVEEVISNLAKPTDQQIKLAQEHCQTIREEAPGCEDFPEPGLIFIYSTS